MNLVRVFQPSSWRRGDDAVAMEPAQSQEPRRKPRRGRPRLDRRNAVKNIEYDAVEADSDESVRGGAGDAVGLRTRSLDIPPSVGTASSGVYFASQTSFRIGGEVEGEFDILCRSLGLSGPEDFAITPADWAAASRVRPLGADGDSAADTAAVMGEEGLSPPAEEKEPPRPEAREGKGDRHVNDALPDRFHFEVRVTDDAVAPVREPIFPMKIGGGGGGGIRGVRPSVLAPPPSMSLPAHDKVSSTWDIVKSFAPDCGDNAGGAGQQRMESSSSESDEEEKDEQVDEDGDVLGRNVELEDDKGVRMGVTSTDLTGSSSFSTSNDDDSSSTTTEGMYIISPNGKLKRNIGSWMKGRLLGSGSFGTVYEAISDDGFFFAVKEVSLLDQGSNAQQCIHQLEQEIALLSQFEHENIVQYYGTDKEDAKLYIFLELITQGSLSSLYQKYHLRDSQVSSYTRQILSGLKYLHERSVVHRDIKCANILVDANGSVKLADFGLAKETTKLSMLKSCKGSVYWMAPEVVNPRRTYGPSADIWSLGCTVLEMLTRQIPFPNLEWTQALFFIGRGGQPTIPNVLSKDARNFIQQCIQVDPDDRPSAINLLDHPFVKRPLSSSWGSDSSTHNSDRRT